MSTSGKSRGRGSGATRQKMVHYLGASTRRRFAGERQAGDISVRAGTWLALIAIVTLALALLGVWQESQGNKIQKQRNGQFVSVPLK